MHKGVVRLLEPQVRVDRGQTGSSGHDRVAAITNTQHLLCVQDQILAMERKGICESHLYLRNYGQLMASGHRSQFSLMVYLLASRLCTTEWPHMQKYKKGTNWVQWVI